MKMVQYGNGYDSSAGEEIFEEERQAAEEEQQRIENGAAINNNTIPSDTIYKNPTRISDGDNAEQNIDDMIDDADEFIESGHSNYNETALQNFSKTMYNILLAVGVAVAVIVGGIIGLRFMTVTSAEEKAEITKLLIPYLIGCIVVFGGFAIWRLAVNILSGL